MKIIIDIPEEVYRVSRIIDVKYEDVIQIPLEVIKNGTLLDSDYDKLMTINQQLAFENEELRENIEEIKEEIGDKYANTHHMYPNYASGLSYAYGIIDKHIGKAESEG